MSILWVDTGGDWIPLASDVSFNKMIEMMTQLKLLQQPDSGLQFPELRIAQKKPLSANVAAGVDIGD